MKMMWNAFCVLAILALVAAPGLASPITVNNFSFETLPGAWPAPNCGTGCTTFVTPISGWVNSGTSGQFQPGPPSTTTFFSTLSDGPTSAFANGSVEVTNRITQTVLPTVVNGMVYTLQVDIGLRADRAFDGTADLLINGVRYVATGSAPTAGNWSTFTAMYTGTASDAGQSITVELNSTGLQGNFDNVRLSDAVPEPASFLLIGSALLILPALRRRRTNS